MTYNQNYPRTVSEKINEDNKKKALFKERYSIGFLPTPQLRD